MSSLTILGDTSGSVLLQAPAVAGSPTVTLPATSMTMFAPQADQWQLTSNYSITGGSTFDISSPLSRIAYYQAGYAGTGMTQSSGVFTFPTTGVWLVTANMRMYSTGSQSRYTQLFISVSQDSGSSFNAVMQATNNLPYITSTTFQVSTGSAMFNITNTSTQKIKFQVGAENAAIVAGGTDNQTYFTFLRVG
jgi:hypothetical protein